MLRSSLSLRRLAPRRTMSTSAVGGFIGCGSSSGQIAVRNAAQKSVFSSSLAETTPRVLSLQRDFLRSVPWIKRAYGVPQPEAVRRRAPCRSPPLCAGRALIVAALPRALVRRRCARC